MEPRVNLPPAGSRVFVGLSGGVDSAVTAALLAQAGLRTTGVFIKGWYPPGMPCSWKEDRRDAMRVAARLHLPFLTLDASETYKKSVIDYLLREYREGRTPNPDIMCNRDVKFGAFYAWARAQGADAIATGHYARTMRHPGNVQLLRGVDPAKDQSYFLWAVESDALHHAYFPLGGLLKTEVREHAAHMRLPNARKRDSQGICFLGNVSIEEFLAQEFGTEAGAAVDQGGMFVGKHPGVHLSTLGQRIALSDAPPGPWYVQAKDIKENTLVVSREKQSVSRHSFQLQESNWLTEPVPKEPYVAQYRYHGPRIPGILDDALASFIPSEPVSEPVAAGQSLVLYQGDTCMGGGIIR